MLCLTACGRLGFELVDDENLPTRSWDAGDAANLGGAGGSAGAGPIHPDANGTVGAGGSLLDSAAEGGGGVAGGTGGASLDAAGTGGAPPEQDASSDSQGLKDAAPPDVPNQDASVPDVASMPEAAPETGGSVLTVDDSVEGTVLNQFDYFGTGWLHCTSCIIGATYYDQSDSWSNVTNDFVSFSFAGTRLRFYGVLDSVHGIGALSIDGGAETMIDFYGRQTLGNQLLWTSPVMPSGIHTVVLRVTGQKNNKSSDYFVTVDRVDVLP